MSKPNARTIVALVAAALLMLTVAFVGALVVLVRNADEPDVTITAYAHGKTVTVRPFSYCTVTMQDCHILPEGNAEGTVFATLPCDQQTPDCHRGRTVELEVPPVIRYSCRCRRRSPTHPGSPSSSTSCLVARRWIG